MNPTRDTFFSTRAVLVEKRKIMSLGAIAEELLYPPSAIGFLSDVSRGRREHVSAKALRDLRQRLGIASPKRWRPDLTEFAGRITAAEVRALVRLFLECEGVSDD